MSPSLHDLLRARFNMTGRSLEKTISRLSDADLPWALGDGMRTVRGLLLEIADKERETIKWIQTGTWPDDDPPTFDHDAATLSEIKTALSDLRKATFAYIDSLTEEELNRNVSSPEGWWEALRLTECPVHEILRNISAHEWYHDAQLIVYLWSRGDDPDTW